MMPYFTIVIHNCKVVKFVLFHRTQAIYLTIIFFAVVFSSFLGFTINIKFYGIVSKKIRIRQCSAASIVLGVVYTSPD